MEGDLTNIEDLKPFFDVPEGWEGVDVLIDGGASTGKQFKKK